MFKVALHEIDLTPTMPAMQAGYVQRTHESTGVHDPLGAVAASVYIDDVHMVWVATDLIGIDKNLYESVLTKVNDAGIALDREHLIIGASHNHSAPSTNVEPNGMAYGTPAYIEQAIEALSSGIIEACRKEAKTAEVYHSELMVDGIYSNRNDADKLSDKKVTLLKFVVDGKDEGVYVTLSCHNTVLGPLNYELTGELFGNLRRKLAKEFGCTVMVAQGTAGDMGNRQYRKKQDYEELENTVTHLAAQIVRKMKPWKKIEVGNYQYAHSSYEARFVLDSSIYPPKIARYEKMLETETDLTARKVMLSGIAGFKRKMAMGDGERVFDMPAEIYHMGDICMISVPGELGSVLGLMIKDACPCKVCIVWAYSNDMHLGYMVDKEAFELECQETNVTKFPAGLCEHYVEQITQDMLKLIG